MPMMSLAIGRTLRLLLAAGALFAAAGVALAQSADTATPSSPVISTPLVESATPVALQGAVEPATAPRRADIPHDLSPGGMFMAADWVVKSVMLALALASVATWTVWLAKTLELAGARHRAAAVIPIIRLRMRSGKPANTRVLPR
ncbi:MAG: hypothetical protein J0626_03820, partial [Rhodospirillaceae bacterium]|nr:hypothetical protein [Rhodospirillaceae bacterium]